MKKIVIQGKRIQSIIIFKNKDNIIKMKTSTKKMNKLRIFSVFLGRT